MNEQIKSNEHPKGDDILKLHAWILDAAGEQYLETPNGSAELYRKLCELWDDGHCDGFEDGQQQVEG
jgi:hypothetical protein